MGKTITLHAYMLPTKSTFSIYDAMKYMPQQTSIQVRRDKGDGSLYACCQGEHFRPVFADPTNPKHNTRDLVHRWLGGSIQRILCEQRWMNSFQGTCDSINHMPVRIKSRIPLSFEETLPLRLSSPSSPEWAAPFTSKHFEARGRCGG